MMVLELAVEEEEEEEEKKRNVTLYIDPGPTLGKLARLRVIDTPMKIIPSRGRSFFGFTDSER
jgi:hypothetical protein